jgi:protein-tyrosine kinase
VSFIYKVLEKAKTFHHQQVKPDPTFSQAAPQPPWPHGDEITGFAETPGEIHYIHTRTVTVDMDRLRRNRLIVAGSDEIQGEAYKLLRTHLLQGTERDSRNTLMFTGPRPNEGKTLTVINLAIAIAHKVGQTVLVVDGDLRNPSVHRYLDLPAGPGLVDYLTAGHPIAECLVHPEGLPNLVVLPAGRSTSRSAELLSSPLMADLVREVKHFYPNRYVLFDLPPLLYWDPLAFAPLVDGIILVVAAGSTPREEITRALNRFKEFPVLGCVLNKINPLRLSYNSHHYYPEGDSQKTFKLPWRK